VYTRPAHRLKLVSQDAISEPGTHLQVSKILEDSTDSTGCTRYLVEWSDHTVPATWQTEQSFDDLTPIRKYWKTKKTTGDQASSSSQQVKIRLRPAGIGTPPTKKVKVNLRAPAPSGASDHS
jgi:hypothetical protein